MQSCTYLMPLLILSYSIRFVYGSTCDFNFDFFLSNTRMDVKRSTKIQLFVMCRYTVCGWTFGTQALSIMTSTLNMIGNETPSE